MDDPLRTELVSAAAVDDSQERPDFEGVLARGKRLKARRMTVGVLATVLLTAGSAAAYVEVRELGRETHLALREGNGRAQPDPGVSTGRVVCDWDGTRVLTPRVRARRDGVHLIFINRSGADEFFMRGVDDPDNNHGGKLRSARQKDVSSHGPGRMWVACFEKEDPPGYYGRDPRYVEFEIVDPHALWVPWELECSDATTIENERVPSATTQEDVFDWFRKRFELPPGDFQRPGYPKTEWKGNPWVLVRDGRTIANMQAFKEDGVWTIPFGGACPRG